MRNRRLAGYKFRRQHPIGRFIFDFYCEEARRSLELEGGQHTDPEQVVKDQKRTAWLALQGIRVPRFWDHHVLKYQDVIAGKICDALMATPQVEGPSKDAVRNGAALRSPSP